MSNDAIKLPRRQRELYELLAGRGDVSIDDLYEAMKGEPARDSTYAQRWLASYISSLNRKLKSQGLRVQPGALKRTYTLARI